MKKEELTIDELKALYRLVKEHEEHAPESEEEIYNDYHDAYEEPISKKIL